MIHQKLSNYELLLHVKCCGFCSEMLLNTEYSWKTKGIKDSVKSLALLNSSWTSQMKYGNVNMLLLESHLDLNVAALWGYNLILYLKVVPGLYSSFLSRHPAFSCWHYEVRIEQQLPRERVPIGLRNLSDCRPFAFHAKNDAPALEPIQILSQESVL